MKHVASWHLFEAKKNIGTLTPDQVKWLNKCIKGTWQVNPETGLVDVEEAFDCYSQRLEDFMGVQFGVVGGGFYCSDNKLTSLVGAPQEVGGNFYCPGNSLTSLEGAPQVVGGNFRCDAFETKNWNMKGWLELLEEGGEGAKLIPTFLPETELDKWFKAHPLDLDLLDKLPKIKAGVLKRTVMRDTSAVARQMRKGII